MLAGGPARLRQQAGIPVRATRAARKSGFLYPKTRKTLARVYDPRLKIPTPWRGSMSRVKNSGRLHRAYQSKYS